MVYDDAPEGKGVRFAAEVRVLATDGRIERTPSSIAVDRTREALLAVAVETSFDGFDLLPALPSAWKTGSVRGLRARGGFTVGESWRDGRLVAALIRADRDGTVRVRYGQVVSELTVKAGKPARYSR